MPHKRKSRFNWNQKNAATRRAHFANQPSEPPHVLVVPTNGEGPEDPIPVPDRPKTSGGRPNAMQKFAVPHYNSCVRKQEELNALGKIRSLVTDSNLSPASKTAIAPRVTQKMNFPIDQTVFKDLVPLNVNDSMLLPHKQQREPSKSRASKENALKTNSDPQLADYAEQIEPITMAIPEPELHLDFPQDHFDFFGAYQKLFY
ncbi:hypothetical protein KR009_010384 [Drosophila setifemur]|nr:hypothetical protein KR009_010384 [Drosophila setifemur]